MTYEDIEHQLEIRIQELKAETNIFAQKKIMVQIEILEQMFYKMLDKEYPIQVDVQYIRDIEALCKRIEDCIHNYEPIRSNN